MVALSSRFNALFDDPLADLVALHQGSDSIITYLDKFKNDRTRLTLPEAHALSIFLTNMNPHLSLHVRQFGVTTVSAAAQIACLHETALAHTPNRYQRAPFNPSTNKNAPFKPQNTTPILPTPPNKPTFIPKTTNDKPTRKYSYQEMQERRAKGLCMFCDEAFRPGHQLKHKRSQIFVMDGDDDDAESVDVDDAEIFPDQTLEENTSEPTPTISVNALSGSTMFNCMRVVGQYGKRKLFILIDLGSTHNFLDIKVANELGYRLEAVNPMSVAAANGNNLVKNFKCSKQLHLDGSKLHLYLGDSHTASGLL